MYQKILIAIDGSPASRQALLEATRMAPPGADLRVVTVLENPLWSVPVEQGVIFDVEAMHQSMLGAGRNILQQASSLLAEKGITATTCLLDLFEHDNSIPGAILEEADHWQADVIVLGTHGRRGFKRLLMGSVAEALLRAAKRPVLLVHEQPA